LQALSGLQPIMNAQCALLKQNIQQAVEAGEAADMYRLVGWGGQGWGGQGWGGVVWAGGWVGGWLVGWY
jgi:hypothetical protein